MRTTDVLGGRVLFGDTWEIGLTRTCRPFHCDFMLWRPFHLMIGGYGWHFYMTLGWK